MLRIANIPSKLNNLQSAKRLVKRHVESVACPVNNKADGGVNNGLDNVRPFEEIPGPKPLILVGNILRFVPYIGEFGNKPLLTQLQMLRDTYGSVVRLEGIINRRKTVFLFDPKLCETMYRVEGAWPTRIAMESLKYYRSCREHVFGENYGLSVSQDKMWHDFRSKVNQHMMQPRAIKPHVEQIDAVASEFVERMKELRDSETLELPATFNNEMNKWALESICSIALGERLGCLEANLSDDSDPQRLINSVHEVFELLTRLELLPSLWKIYKTSDLKRMFRVMDTLNGICIKNINKTKEKLKKETTTGTGERSVLEKLLRIDEHTASVMAIDMLTAGVDTTSNAAGSVLYYMARNPRCQKKLFNEVKSVLPTKSSPVTFETVQNIPYLKACIKETLRVAPIAVGGLRTMQTDVVIGGYKIPNGTDVIAGHALLSLDPNEFPRPDEFIPERWLRDDKEFPLAKDAHPFCYMPFGFGVRSCVGKRFAELEMETLILKVLRNFRLEWHHGPLEFKSRFINTITTPLQLKLIDV